jgi:hypothetical protein
MWPARPTEWGETESLALFAQAANTFFFDRKIRDNFCPLQHVYAN